MESTLTQLDALAGTKPGAAPKAPGAPVAGSIAELDALAAQSHPTPTTPKLTPGGILDSISSGIHSAADKANTMVGGPLESLLGMKKPVSKTAPKTSALDALDALSGTEKQKTKPTPTLDSLEGKTPAEPLFGGDPAPSSFGEQTSSMQVGDGNDTFAFIKNALQALPRDAAAAGAAIGQAAENVPLDLDKAAAKIGIKTNAQRLAADTDIANKAAEVASDVNTSGPGSGFTHAILGSEPIPSLTNTAAQYETAINSSDFAKKHGLDKYSTQLAVLGATAPVGLDFFGVGGEEGAVKALMKSTDLAETAKMLRQMGVHEDLVLPAAQHLVTTDSKYEVEQTLKTIESLQKTTKAVAPADTTTTLHAPPGIPDRLYHGTATEFPSFDPGKQAAGNFGKGIYLTDNQSAASYHALSADKRAAISEVNPETLEYRDPTGGKVMDVKLYPDAKVKTFDSMPTQEMVEEAKNAGFDAVSYPDDLYKNAEDWDTKRLGEDLPENPRTTLVFNEKAIAPIAAAPEPVLPRALSGAKPRYGYQDKQFTLNFASDTDKAAYIVAQKTASKSDGAYMDFLRSAYPGMSDAEIRALGADVRTTIKGLAKDAEHGEPLEIPRTTPAAEGGRAAAESIGEGMKAVSTAEKAAPRAASVVGKDLENALQYQAFLKDTLPTLPGRDLMKYRSSATGELPYIEKGATSKFGKRGDVMLQEILGQDASGNGDIDIANERLKEYVRARDEKVAVDTQVKELRAEMREAKQGEKESNRNRSAAKQQARRAERQHPNYERPQRSSYRKPVPGDQSTGDYLRRGAVREDVRPKPIPEGMPRGDASLGSQKAAVADTLYGDIEKGPFAGFTTRMKNWYQDWIFARQASNVETKLALKPFESLKKEGMEWVDSFTGHAEDGVTVSDHTGLKGQVKDLLDRWLEEEQAAGIKVAEKKDYFPIYLKDIAASEAEDTLGERRLGLRPGFSLRSEFKDYAEARAAGREPRFTSPYDILKTRAMAHFKAMADANMFRKGVSNGWIIPEQAIDPSLRSEYKILDPNSFPHMPTVYGNTVNVRNFAAPTKLAAKIGKYLTKPNETLNGIARFAGTVKNTALSVGIPGTGLSVHFWNVLPREAALALAVSPIHAPFEIGKYLYYGINPRAAQKFIDNNLKRALPLVRAGMKISTEDHGAADEFMKVLKKVTSKRGDDMMVETPLNKAGQAYKGMSDFLHNVFAAGTFGKVLPARKIANGLKLMDFYTKKGLSVDEAARLAADDVNTVYGGINWESLGRDRNFQTFLRSALMAPDYAETNLRLGARMVKAFKNPKSVQSQLYRRMAAAYVGTYMTANLINYENSGHFMWQNDILHQLSLDLGKGPNGKERYFNVFGTGADFARIPMEIVTAIAKGNFQDLNSIVRNRLSIPASSAFSLLENVDWKGDPIFGPDRFGNPQSGKTQAGNAFENTVGNVLPGSLQTIPQLAAGKETVPQFATQAAGLPFSYKNIAPGASDIAALKAKATAGIQKGDYRLFNQLVKAGAITARSKSTFIRTALKGKTAKAQATAAKNKVKAAKVKQNLLDQGFTNSQ